MPVVVTNVDNDRAGITVTPTSGLVTTEAGGTADVTVRLDSQPASDVTIALYSSDTTEGIVSPASLTFTPDTWSTPQAATVTGNNDWVVDGNVVYKILVSPATSSDPNYSSLKAADVTLTNADDDVAGITVSPTSGLVTTEVGGTATFTVRLTSEPLSDVTIALSSDDLTEGVVSPSSLIFTSVNWNAAQIVTITGLDDWVVDGSVSYKILTTPAVSSDGSYNGLKAADVTVTNTDNDAAGIVVSPTSGLVTTEAGGMASFTIRLTSQPAADVTIPVSSNDTTEGTVSPASLVFTPGNWSIPQTVTVTGIDDLIADGDVAYAIIVGSATSSDPHYNNLLAANATVTNLDNDQAGIVVSPTSGLVTTEAGGTASFTIRLTSQPTADVTIPVSSNDTTEGTVSPASLVFTPENWSTPQTVLVTGVDDVIEDGNVSYSIITGPATSSDPTYHSRKPADVMLITVDDDIAGISVDRTGLRTTESGGKDVFSVRLNTATTADVTLVLFSSDLTEGVASPTSLVFTSRNWDTAQTVTVSGVDDLVMDGDVNYTIILLPTTSSIGEYSDLQVPVPIDNLVLVTRQGLATFAVLRRWQ